MHYAFGPTSSVHFYFLLVYHAMISIDLALCAAKEVLQVDRTLIHKSNYHVLKFLTKLTKEKVVIK